MFEKAAKFSVLCLAGGFGTRVKHILKNTPKPLAQIMGKPFLYWLISDLKSFGADEIFLLTHFNAQEFVNFASLISDESCNVSCVEEKHPEGTGGAILSAIKAVEIKSQNVIILNGDTFIKMDYKQLLNKLEHDIPAVMSGKFVENTSRYGTLNVDEKGMLRSIKEKENDGPGHVNAGVFAANVEFLKKLREKKRPLSLETELIPKLLNSGYKIKVHKVFGKFLDIGTESSLLQAEQFIANVMK